MPLAVKEKDNVLEALFKAGAHFGFDKSRRHPSVKDFVFTSKNRADIFDLEKTSTLLDEALSFVKKLGEEGGVLLFVGGKNEAREAVKDAASQIGMPFVAGRWVGGTLTNFPQIRKRIDTMLDLISQKDKGELSKYTKKERLLIDRDIERLQTLFSGLVPLTSLPKAIFLVDARYEETAREEAKQLNIPIVALCSSDNNIKEIDYPLVGNDSSRTSIKYFTDKIKEAYSASKS